MSDVAQEGEPDFLSTVGSGPFGLQYGADGIVNAAPVDEFQTSLDLDGLLQLGCLTDDFTLYGHRFTIRTLKRGEKLALGQLVQEYAETFAVGDAIGTATVAACILLVDSRPLSPPLGVAEDHNPISWIRRNFQVVSDWYDPVIDGVYQKYQALLARQTKAFLDLQGK